MPPFNRKKKVNRYTIIIIIIILLGIKIERKSSIQGNNIEMNAGQAKERESSIGEKPHGIEISPAGNPQVMVTQWLCFGLYNVHQSCYDRNKEDQSTDRNLPSKPIPKAFNVFIIWV